MKKALIAFALSLVSLLSGAQRLAYDVSFDYIFLNAEFDRSNNVFEHSGTLHAARLTPLVGLDWNQGRRASHSVRCGVDLFRNMGEKLPAGDVFGEVLLYYRADVPVRRTRGTFSAIAGIFPRSFSEGKYGDAFFSDDVLFVDNNFEGMFFKYSAPHIYADLGLDWCGMKGLTRRESFRIMSAGKADLFGTDLFAFGWSASMFHYAGSQTVRGVVDNTLVNPYLVADLASVVPMRQLSFKTGPLVGYQWDRVNDSQKHMPWGIESLLTAQLHDFGVENQFYWGDDLYYYDEAYGTDVYYGEPFYSWPWEGKSWMDKFSVFYEPRISESLSLNVSVEFYFGGRNEASPVLYRGTIQKLTLNVDLDHLFRNR